MSDTNLQKLETRFLSKCKKEQEITSAYVSTPCWIWLGNVDKYGYGYLTVMQPHKHKALAHRVSMMLFKPTETIEGLHVCHSCHNRLCMNPEHLHSGTAADNIAEMVSANHQSKGTELPQAVLNETTVIIIIQALNKGVPRKDLAARHGVSLSTIDGIAQGRSWKHVHLLVST